MTIALVYDNTLSRVTIDASALDLSATEALVERSTDQIKWTVVRGGAAVVVSDGEFPVPLHDYEFIPDNENHYRLTPDVGSAETDSIIPVLTATWIKSIARPFLNMSFLRSEIVSTVTRHLRNNVFDIVGRSIPIGLTDVSSSRQYDIRVDTQTFELGEEFDLLFASGDILFLHVPSSWPYKSAYFVPMEVPREFRWSTEWSTWTITVREIAAPGPDVVGSASTYQTILNTYTTYNELLLGHTDYADVLTLIGDPSEVIVP